MADQARDSHGADAAASDAGVGDITATGVSQTIESVRLRRTPKYPVFLVLGAVLGVLTAVILTFAVGGSGEESPNTGMLYTPGQVFGFLALVGIAVGVTLGGVVALILDRTVGRRSRQVLVDREHVRVPDGL